MTTMMIVYHCLALSMKYLAISSVITSLTTPTPLLTAMATTLSSSTTGPYYYSTSDLGIPNTDTTLSNPLKGFLTNPEWSTPPYDFPSSLEFYYIGLSKVMTAHQIFDWDTYVEPRLDDTASRHKHAILRFVIDYPNDESYIPQYLIDDYGLKCTKYTTYGGGCSPDYNNEQFQNALISFIEAFGQSYDGDSRIAFIQVGLLGFWGEWHTYTDGSGVSEGWIPSTLKDNVVVAFNDAFHKTPLQTRYVWPKAMELGFGLHDDSFAYSTLDGDANGGVDTGWFFWSQVESAQYTDFWKSSVMGGELRPALQSTIFSDSYPAGTEYHQDFTICVDTTHATYMLNYYAFSGDGYNNDNNDELDRAREASANMGYMFRVTQVSVAKNNNLVDIYVTVEQFGLAPFYYPLSLTLSCSDMSLYRELSDVDTVLISKGDSETFTFVGISASKTCLDNVNIGLYSAHVFNTNNPVKFAQGTDGTYVSVSLPTPPPSTKTCKSVGSYKYIRDEFCTGRTNHESEKYAKFWQIQSGSKKKIRKIPCISDVENNVCTKEDCCKIGPKRRCKNTGLDGLVPGGFTKDMCISSGSDDSWILRSNKALKKRPCRKNDGYNCDHKDCCRKKKGNSNNLV